ncbi:MAG: TraR/DksA family transcriptional regulator [Desulfuromonadaceae bacterium]
MKNSLAQELHNDSAAYMSTQQLDYFRQRLEEWRETVLAKTDEYSTLMQQDPVRLPDLIDQSVKNMSREMTLVNAQRSRRLVAQINAALERIKDGSFGYCLASGEEIGLKRLHAWPIATLSVEVQQDRERLQKMRACM